MRLVRLTQPRPDNLVIDEGRDWRRAGVALVLTAVWVGVAMLLEADSGALVAFLISGMFVLPLCALAARRWLRRRVLSVVRTPGRLFLDGEPLELARIELRVTHWPVIKTPTGYALSLWVMTATGPEDVALGHFESMLDASRVGGHLEDFIARATNRQPGRTPLS